MKTVHTILIGILFAITLACGYSPKNYSSGSSSMPAIAQLNPGSATAGEATFMLTVTGSNFASKAVVNWNATAQMTTFVNTGQLTIQVPASAVANAGMVQITVTNPGSNGMYGSSAQTSAAVPFTIQ